MAERARKRSELNELREHNYWQMRAFVAYQEAVEAEFAQVVVTMLERQDPVIRLRRRGGGYGVLTDGE